MVTLPTVAAYAAVAERRARRSSAWEITAPALSDAGTVLHTLSDQASAGTASRRSDGRACRKRRIFVELP